jgi:hypothetical protein
VAGVNCGVLLVETFRGNSTSVLHGATTKHNRLALCDIASCCVGNSQLNQLSALGFPLKRNKEEKKVKNGLTPFSFMNNRGYDVYLLVASWLKR